MGNVSLIDGHIDEPKFTDNEIKKALECCGKENCWGCPYRGNCHRGNPMIRNALDLVNRLEAENKRLNKEVDRLSQVVLYHDGQIIDVIKEFAEGLKEKACSYDLPDYHSFDAVTVEDIDDFAKEMEKKYDNRADN